ncbi:hypothetical protein WI697_24680 [Tistrella mobilis]|uniref:hypothetical protein n=1 Tax=Tistrella mobilis TaxID=171437 RepID=UPI0031F6D323
MAVTPYQFLVIFNDRVNYIVKGILRSHLTFTGVEDDLLAPLAMKASEGCPDHHRLRGKPPFTPQASRSSSGGSPVQGEFRFGLSTTDETRHASELAQSASNFYGSATMMFRGALNPLELQHSA